MADSLSRLLPGRCIHGIMGVFQDKEYVKIVQILQPVIQDVIAVTASGPRGLPAAELKQVWMKAGSCGAETAESVTDALKKAVGRCGKEDAIVLFGSLSLLRELKWRTS